MLFILSAAPDPLIFDDHYFQPRLCNIIYLNLILGIIFG